MGEDLVLNDRGVVVDEDVFDGKGGDFGKENAAKGVGDGGIDADKREGSIEGLEFVKFDLKGLGGSCQLLDSLIEIAVWRTSRKV